MRGELDVLKDELRSMRDAMSTLTRRVADVQTRISAIETLR